MSSNTQGCRQHLLFIQVLKLDVADSHTPRQTTRLDLHLRLWAALFAVHIHIPVHQSPAWRWNQLLHPCFNVVGTILFCTLSYHH